MTQKEKISNKKIITIVIVLTIVFIVSVVGTILYLKGNGRTEAHTIETREANVKSDIINNMENVNDFENVVEEENVNKENYDTEIIEENKQPENEEEALQKSEKNDVQNNVNVDVSKNVEYNIEQNKSNVEEKIQETVITRDEIVEIPEKKLSEEHNIEWEQVNLNVKSIASKINAVEDEIIVNKRASEKVQQGENIDYAINIVNKSNRKLSKLEVKERFKSNAVDLSKIEFKSSKGDVIEELNSIIWKVDIDANSSIDISFSVPVKVQAEPESILENSTIVNGEEKNQLIDMPNMIQEPVRTVIEKATKKITIEKVWIGDEGVGKDTRPSKLDFYLENDKVITLTPNDEEKDNSNKWSKTVEFDKYDNEGNEILYKYIDDKIEWNKENKIDFNKLTSYTKTNVDESEENKIVSISTYRAPEISNEKITVTALPTILNSKDEMVTYSIDYYATLKYFRGSIVTSIELQLPYEIDNQYRYDPNTKTMKWEITDPDIDTYTTGGDKQEKPIHYTRTVKVKYKDLENVENIIRTNVKAITKFENVNIEGNEINSSCEIQKNF